MTCPTAPGSEFPRFPRFARPPRAACPTFVRLSVLSGRPRVRSVRRGEGNRGQLIGNAPRRALGRGRVAVHERDYTSRHPKPRQVVSTETPLKTLNFPESSKNISCWQCCHSWLGARHSQWRVFLSPSSAALEQRRDVVEGGDGQGGGGNELDSHALHHTPARPLLSHVVSTGNVPDSLNFSRR